MSGIDILEVGVPIVEPFQLVSHLSSLVSRRPLTASLVSWLPSPLFNYVHLCALSPLYPSAIETPQAGEGGGGGQELGRQKRSIYYLVTTKWDLTAKSYLWPTAYIVFKS